MPYTRTSCWSYLILYPKGASRSKAGVLEGDALDVLASRLRRAGEEHGAVLAEIGLGGSSVHCLALLSHPSTVHRAIKALACAIGREECLYSASCVDPCSVDHIRTRIASLTKTLKPASRLCCGHNTARDKQPLLAH